MPSEGFDLHTAREALERCWSDGASGSHEVAPGRYVQWARWPEGVQVECSSDDFWQDGELTFLQRRVLAKLGFTPPEAALPHYWMRAAARDDLDAAAQALVRCVREVLTPAEDGPVPERPDLGRELLTCFGARGLAYPYVPEFAIEQLSVHHPGTFTTFEVDRKELYLMLGVLDELLEPLREPRFAVSYWGHGMNSYAWTVRLERPGLRMVLQCGYGGVYPSSDQDEQLAEIFSVSRQIDLLVPRDVERDVILVFSRMRGLSVAGFAPDSRTRLRGWIGGHHVEDLVEAVEALLTPPSDPEQPWQDLASAFLHALHQTAGTGSDTIAFETKGYLIYLTVDVHEGPITATIMPTEDADELLELGSEAQELLRRSGWHSTQDLPNPHLRISGPDQFHAAAQAMTDAVRWVWEVDAAEATAQVFALVGGDDGGGDWD
jgi:hypothetical protein